MLAVNISESAIWKEVFYNCTKSKPIEITILYVLDLDLKFSIIPPDGGAERKPIQLTLPLAA